MALTPEEQAELESINNELLQLDSTEALADTSATPLELPAQATPSKQDPGFLEAALPATAQTFKSGSGDEGFFSFKNLKNVALANVTDFATFLPRFVGALKSLAPGDEQTFAQAMADIEGGPLKEDRIGAREFWLQKEKETDSKALKQVYGLAAVAGETGFSLLEDLGVSLGTRAGVKTVGVIGKRAAPNIKATVASASGIPQETLEQASKVPVSEIKRAGGTERQIAEQIEGAISPAGEKQALTQKGLLPEKARLEQELIDEGVQVRVRQPTTEVSTTTISKESLAPETTVKQVKDPTAELIDPKTGNKIPFPIDVLENVGNNKAFTTSFAGAQTALKKELDQILSATKGKKELSAKDAIQMKQQIQAAMSDKFDIVGKKQFDNVMKTYAAATRASIEEAAIKAGKPEYVQLMRELSADKGVFKRARANLAGQKKGFDSEKAASSIDRKLQTFMNKNDHDAQTVLRDLDDILNSAGIPSNLASEANLAALSRKTGITKGGTPLTNIITTGKSLTIPLLLTTAGLGGPTKFLGFMAGMTANNPLAARATFSAINWVKAADTSPKVQALLNSLDKAQTAAQAIKIMNRLDKETQGQEN